MELKKNKFESIFIKYINILQLNYSITKIPEYDYNAIYNSLKLLINININNLSLITQNQLKEILNFLSNKYNNNLETLIFINKIYDKISLK